MGDLKQRVVALMGLRGISQAEASRRGGFTNKAFINDIVRGHKLSVRGDSLEQLAKAFDTTEAYLLGKTDDPEPPTPNSSGSKDPGHLAQGFVEVVQDVPTDFSHFPQDVPVRGIAVGGEDADFTFNGQTVEHVRRPAGLARKRDVYALRIEGESMWPAYRHGALIYVDPHRRPGIGEDAVIELHPDREETGEPGRGFIKRVKRMSGGNLVVEQFNPPIEIKFSKYEIKNIHRVVPWEEVLGF